MHTRRRAGTIVKLIAVAAWALPLTVSFDSWSETTPDGRKECVDAYVRAQEYRKSDDLLGARASLWKCAATVCPGIIQSDCTSWLNQVVESIPSVVLEAKLGDDSVFEVTVSMDGTALTKQLDGKPIEINPGLHTFVFERAGAAPIEKRVIVAARARSQVVSATWTPPQPAASAPLHLAGAGAEAPAAPVRTRPVPVLTYVLGGVAVAAFGTFVGFGAAADQTQHDLESSCSPGCSSSDVSSLKARFIVADIAAGVSALAAGGALAVFFMRPETKEREPVTSAVRIAPLNRGATLEWTGALSF
jgi:hypothetical protein